MNLYEDDIRERLFVEVYNIRKLEGSLRNVVHTCKEDLVEVYRLSGFNERIRRDSDLVTSEQLARWGVDEETFKRDAWANTMKKRPPILIDLMDASNADFSRNHLTDANPVPEGIIGELEMYVLTNRMNNNGAVYMFDEETMQKVAGKLGGNLIVLPASVHETIVYAEEGGMDISRAKSMVQAVNQTSLREEDLLSGEIYRYDKDSHTLSMVQIPKLEEINMPDKVSMEEMYAYGYLWNGMLPLTKEKALELLDTELTLFKLYSDGVEVMVDNREEILAYDGLFGVGRDAWIKYLDAQNQSAAEVMEQEVNVQKSQDERLPFDEFVDYVKGNIKNYLPQEYQDAKVSVTETIKNNSIFLNSLCIAGKENMTPSIYLEYFYKHYSDGVSLNAIMEGIADTYLRNRVPQIQFTMEDFAYEKIKDNICVTVCNAEQNKKMLQDVPHELREDFALVYRIKVTLNNQMNGTILIQNCHMEHWGIDKNTLREQAWHNMEHRFPYQLSDIRELLESEYGAFGWRIQGEGSTVYVLSNPERAQGAAYMFEHKAMEDIAKKFATDMYVLPISVNECILIKSDEVKELDELKGMVECIYETGIPLEHALSKDIYLFDWQEQTLSKVDFSQEQGMSMTQQM